MTKDQKEILSFVAKFSDNVGPLSEDPGAGHALRGVSWLEAVEDLKRDWISHAPPHWFDILIDLVEHPVDVSGEHNMIGEQSEEDRAYNIAIILGLWGQYDSRRFFDTICPRIMGSPARATLISAIGECLLPEGIDCLEPAANAIHELAEDEIIRLVDAIGDIAMNTKRKKGLQVIALIEAALPGDFAAAKHEVQVYLRHVQPA